MVVLVFLFICDMFLLNIAFLLSFLVRYGLDMPANFDTYKDNFAFLTFMYMLALIFAGVFKKRFSSLWDLFRRIFLGLFLGVLFGVALVYVFRVKWGSFPSGIFVVSLPIALLLVFTFNSLVLGFFHRIKKKVVIIGDKGCVKGWEGGPFVETEHINGIEELLEHKDIDEVMICERVHEGKEINLLIYLLLKLKVNVVFDPAIYAELLSRNVIDENSVEFLATFIGKKSDCEEFLIRAFDILGSLLVLIVLSPIIAVVSVLIKLTSSGSIFYNQVRVAKDGRTFTLYKFKTMVSEAEKETGPVMASRDDPRVTKIGRFLRNTRIDEVPQLLNVIRGEMSLVGPRPERPYFVNTHKVLKGIRLAVKPGLTGLAQIRGCYDLHPKHKTKYDYLYIQKRSLRLNLYILARTIPLVFLRKGQ